MMTTIKILAIIYLSFCIYSIVKLGFAKTWSVLRWLNTYLIIGVAHVLLPLYPLAWQMRKWKFNILWVLLDDSRLDKTTETGFSEDYRIYLMDNYDLEKETFIGALKWHIGRNKLYNLINFFKVPNGDPFQGNQNIDVVSYIGDDLRDGWNRHLYQDKEWVKMAQIKYVPKNEGDDPWQVNNGVIQNRDTSIIGAGGIWYRAVGSKRLLFRYSSAKVVKTWFGERWRIIKIGTNSSRNILTIQYKKVKYWN